MGIGCSCGPCDSPWGRLRTRLETAAKRRKNARRTCLCRRRPRFLRIRRKTRQKKKKCTCQPKVKYCVQEASSVVCGSQASSPDLSPPVKNVCRFTVDAESCCLSPDDFMLRNYTISYSPNVRRF
ncbi:hypothetical protein ABMA28_010073 [Loxostege sticticalis]|uniref:Uncharacterized protein n=1 Tax=Loxostege sticticalis TaxID=481309 RepID=A0ABD0SAM2_LOXSC